MLIYGSVKHQLPILFEEIEIPTPTAGVKARDQTPRNSVFDV